MTTLAITGATGFVGRSLVAYFSARGYRVLAFGRRPSPWLPDVPYCAWDIAAGPLRVAEAIDAVIHCAAAVTEWGTVRDLYPANVAGTRHVLATFREAGQFIHLSSASVYDPLRPKRRVREDAPYPARYLDAYSRTKMLAEGVVQRAANRNRAILRPHIVYGPGDTTLLPRLLRARRGGRFLVLGDGRNRLSLTYILNLAAAIALLLAHPCDGEVFNISDSRVGSVDAILGAFLQTFGFREPLLHIDRRLAMGAARVWAYTYRALRRPAPPLVTPYVVAQMSQEFTLDITKAQRLLGYTPQVDYLSGFRAIRDSLPRADR